MYFCLNVFHLANEFQKDSALKVANISKRSHKATETKTKKQEKKDFI